MSGGRWYLPAAKRGPEAVLGDAVTAGKRANRTSFGERHGELGSGGETPTTMWRVTCSAQLAGDHRGVAATELGDNVAGRQAFMMQP